MLVVGCYNYHISDWKTPLRGHYIYFLSWKSIGFFQILPQVFNVQITAQLPSFHMLEKEWSKFSKQASSTWTEKFKVFRLDLEKADEPEIKLPASIGS